MAYEIIPKLGKEMSFPNKSPKQRGFSLICWIWDLSSMTQSCVPRPTRSKAPLQLSQPQPAPPDLHSSGNRAIPQRPEPPEPSTSGTFGTRVNAFSTAGKMLKLSTFLHSSLQNAVLQTSLSCSARESHTKVSTLSQQILMKNQRRHCTLFKWMLVLSCGMCVVSPIGLLRMR